MDPFTYVAAADEPSARGAASVPGARYLAGGTTLVDLMKLHVERPPVVVDINAVSLTGIERLTDGGVRVGALVRNSDMADHELIRSAYPMLSQAILAGASAQVRNMATTGGNMLQRTRCAYFRDTAASCNKREPGSGCAALDGYNRSHAVLGVTAHCIATHPSDMCVALAALDAIVRISGDLGERTIPFTQFHVLPGDRPDRESVLEPGELITAVDIPALSFATRSSYLKVRDRASYAFALAAAAVALDVRDGTIRDARIALGGVATKPWRALEAERMLLGRRPDAASYRAAADAALADAAPGKHNRFKIELAKAHDRARAHPYRRDGMIGDPLNRLDGRLKVTGAARYSAEWPMERLAYGIIVQSTIARGVITSIDTAAAKVLPGVLTVLTADNALRLPEHGRAAVRPPGGRVLSLLQDREVRYNGEPIALVVAESFEQATYAASLVRATYRSETASVDMQKELPNAHPYTQKILGQFEPASRRGDVQAALHDADATIDGVYTTPLETHNAMEPHATIAEWEGDRLTLYDATQYVYGVKRFVAKTFGLPEDGVRVISKFVGGAFGSKGSAWSHVVLAAMAAKQVQRPVKIVLTRPQMFGPVGARPYTVQHLIVGARKDGSITAIKQDVASSTSTFEDWVESSTLQTRMLYDVPNVETSQKLVRLNVGTPTFNRGPGESSGTFGLESAIDELAVKLGVDPIELRLKNYAEKDPESGRPFSSKSLRHCYARGAERFGWSRRNPKPRSMRNDGALVGWGMATATYPAKRLPASAIARLTAGGTIVVEAATHEFGTGTSTSMSQVAADALGVPVERIRFELGDTNFPENPISAGSMTAASTGPAVHAAALSLRDRIASLGGNAADEAGCRALIAANGGQPVEARADARPGAEQQRYSMHSFGAVFAEVQVDPDLGTIHVSRIVGAYGVGRVLNAKTARSQLVGGIIYGLSMALHEDTVIDPRTGRYLNADLSEYLLPVNADVGDIDVIFVDERDSHVDPIGVKGIGEVGATGVAAAIANGIWHATGVRIRDLPITLDKLLTP